MRFLTILITGLFMMTASVASALAEAPAQETSHVTKLANGLTVLVKPDDRFPLVSLRLYVHAGSAYERPEEAGISHMLEHMVFKGTEKRPKGQVASDIEATGGYLNAATSFDFTYYLTDMTKEHWKTGLDVLKDMAFQPSLDPAELESEKDVVVAELNRGEDNPGQRLFRMTLQSALKGTPYYNPIIGYENTVRSLSSETMRAYIERLYQPASMLLLICGNVDPDEALAEAKRQFGDLRNNHDVVPPAALREPAPAPFTATVESGPWNKVHLALAVPVPGMNDVRSAQLDVLAQILGGDASSRFYRLYKYEKRLVDSISVSNYSFERLGLIYIRAVLDAEKLPEFWKNFTRDLARLNKTAFSKEELQRAKLNIEDDIFRSKETLAGYASKLGTFAFFGEGEQSEANYLNTVNTTDPATLHDLINRHLRPDNFSLVVLLPNETPLPDKKHRVNGQTPESHAAWLEQVFQETCKSRASARESAPAADTAGAEGQTELVDLGQGRTVVFIPDETLPYTAVNMIFTGGDALLAEKDQGLAAFTASLLTKGTKKLNAAMLEEYLSDRAAAFGASSGRRTFSISMNAPARFADDMFALLRDSLVTPAMKEEEATRVRESQIAAIVSREDQPTGLALRRMFPFLFGNHPYGYLQQGEKERVAEFRATDAREFWQRQTLQPWVLAVCGVFDREAVLEAVEKLPIPAVEEQAPDAPQWRTDKNLDLRLPGRNQAHLFMIYPTVGFGSPDEPGLELLQNVLAGQSGLLFRDLRDAQGLGYTVTAFPWKTEKAGVLIFYIGTEPDKMRQAEDGFRKIIGDLQRDTLPEAELLRGKNQMTGDYYRDHQSLASRSAEAAVLTVLHRPLDTARTLVDRAQKVSPEQIKELAQKYLQPEKAYILKVLP